MKKRASCIIAFHPKTGEILAATRRGTTTDFGIIGGKIDEGETPLEAAAREFEEETGFKITNAVWSLDLIDVVNDDHGYECNVFMLKGDDVFLVAKKFQELQEVEPGILVGYVSYGTLLDGSFKDFNKRFLDKIFTYMMRFIA